MNDEDATVGPLQIVLVGFETTDRFRGDIARELGALRGRGMLRVLDARLFHRAPDGKLTEIDLNPVLAEAGAAPNRAIAHLLGANGGGGNGARRPAEAFARTAGFALEDLRRLTDEIGPGDHAAVLLVEHLWAARLRETVREAGGRLLGQGFLTPEVVMIVGAEIQARADAEAAIELAQAARGGALVEALEGFGAGTRRVGRGPDPRRRGGDRDRDGPGGDRRGGGPAVRGRLTAAEREGFEPSDEVDPRHTISSRARSAAPAPLLEGWKGSRSRAFNPRERTARLALHAQVRPQACRRT